MVLVDHSKVVVVAKVEVEVSVDAAVDVMSLAPTTKIVLRKMKTRQSVKNAELATMTNSKLCLLTNQEAAAVEAVSVAEVIP